MRKMSFIPVVVAGLALSAAVPALAQSSGEVTCEMDLQRIDQLYRERQYVLTEDERMEAMKLRQVAESKCQQGGQEQLAARSDEARALLEKLENAPPQSQTQIPRSR